MVSVLLDGISNILSAATRHGEAETVAELIEECGGLDKLEELQAHENEQLYKKALEIIETFFPDEEGVDVRLLFSVFKVTYITCISQPQGRIYVLACPRHFSSSGEAIRHFKIKFRFCRPS